MLINVDAKHLDWTTAVYLAQDEVGMREIREGFDLHTDNQKVFGLPSRLIAKVFLFRLIFGGSSNGFAYDNDFAECKFNVKQWDEVIAKFYRKYKGIHKWHESIVREATKTGTLSIPTGRSWKFVPFRNKRGELEFPITTVKNYPVQGLEADMMSIARVSLFNRIQAKDSSILMINSVHDSILLDTPDEHIEWCGETIASVFRDVPKNFKRLFGVEFNIPFRGEVQVGLNYKDMKTVDNLVWE
jgi:DNA polymerase I-like protein with 3'-5' exonuclease and polymerase domains